MLAFEFFQGPNICPVLLDVGCAIGGAYIVFYGVKIARLRRPQLGVRKIENLIAKVLLFRDKNDKLSSERLHHLGESDNNSTSMTR